MPRPIVEVLQSVANIQTTVTDPTQATVIVGPNYDVIPYSADAVSKDSAKLQDSFDPYAYGATTWSSLDIDLSARGNIDPDSIKVFLESPFYEVGVTSDKSIRSVFGAADTTSADMSNNAEAGDKWSLRLEHSALGSFRDANTRDLRTGDTVQLEFQLSNVFNPTADFTPEELASLNSPDNYATITIAAVNGGAEVRVFKFSDSLSSSLSHVDLYEVFAEAAVFSVVDGNNDLVVVPGSAATLTVKAVATNAEVFSSAGSLSAPVQTTTVVKDQSANDFSYIHVADRLRQFVSSHLALNSQQASGRIEAELAEDYTIANNVSVSIPNLDGDWSYDAATSTLSFNNSVTLSDTDIANASIIDARDKDITRADIYVSSRSLVTTSSNLAQTVSSLDFATKLGLATPDNPLGLAVSVALQNSGTSSIKFLRVAEDSSAGLIAALSYLNSDPAAYSIIPLTQDLSVINAYAVAAKKQSEPSVGRFRVVLGSAESAPLWRYWAGTRSSEYGRSASNLASGSLTNALKAAGNAGTAVLDDPEGGFLSVGGPSAGDTVVFSYSSDSSSTVTCTVASIESNSRLILNLPEDAEVQANVNADVFYTGAVSLVGKTDLQVEDLVKSIDPLTSDSDIAKRLVMVYPGSVSVGDHSDLPGYYLTAALGGMLAAFEPHRPKNQIAVSGIADIEYSNLGYFTDSQIDTLSDGGYFVFVQEVAGGLPFCVNQVTAAYKNYQSTQEFSQLSVVNNFDYVSSVFKASLSPYVGVWNVVPQAFSSIRASLDSTILSLRSRSVDRIGAPLLGGEVISVTPSEADAGTVNVLLDVQLPKVLTKIRLEIVSQ